MSRNISEPWFIAPMNTIDISWYIHNKPKLSQQLTHINSWSHDSLRQLQRWAGWSPSPCRSKRWLFVATVLWSAPKHNAKPTMLWKHGLFSGWCLFELFCVLFRWLQADKNRADGDGMVDVPKESRHELKRPRGQAQISSIHNIQLNMLKWTFTSGWWFGTMEFYFSIYWVYWSQLTHIVQRGRSTTKQYIIWKASKFEVAVQDSKAGWFPEKILPESWSLEREKIILPSTEKPSKISSELAQSLFNWPKGFRWVRYESHPPTLNIPSMVPNMCKSPTKLWFLDGSWKVFANFDCQAACCWTESFAGGLIIYKSVGFVNPFWVQDVSQQFDNIIMLYM